MVVVIGFFFSSRRRHTRWTGDWSSDVCSSDLAVVEAKAWDEALTEGVAQAKNYAGKMAIRYTYSTNGQGIYGIDMETGKEGEKRSEERRVGKECRTRRMQYHLKKKKITLELRE